jgi:hypothetical protein
MIRSSIGASRFLVKTRGTKLKKSFGADASCSHKFAARNLFFVHILFCNWASLKIAHILMRSTVKDGRLTAHRPQLVLEMSQHERPTSELCYGFIVGGRT